MLGGREVSFEAPMAVLAAVTIETAKLAVRSRLTNSEGLIRREVTGHPICFHPFQNLIVLPVL